MTTEDKKTKLEELQDRLEQCLDDLITLKSKVDGFAACELNDACFDMDKVIAGVNAALRGPRMHPDDEGFMIEDEEAAAEVDALGQELKEVTQRFIKKAATFAELKTAIQ